MNRTNGRSKVIYIQTFVVTAAVLVLDHLLRPAIPTPPDPGGVYEVFFAVFGVIYAVVVGFVLLVVLENYHGIERDVGSEINALQDIRDFLVYLDNNEQAVDEVRAALRAYARSVIDDEWPRMAAGRLELDTSAEIYAIMAAIHRIEPTNPSDLVALEQLIAEVGRLTTHRTNRIAGCHSPVPGLLLHAIVLLSMITIAVFAIVPFQDHRVELLLVGANTFACSLIYMIVADLNHPLRGYWQIEPTAYADFVASSSWSLTRRIEKKS